MKKIAFFLVLGTCIGTFNLHAQWENQTSFGLSGNILWQDVDLSEGNQYCSMFSLGLYLDTYYFLENLPIGFFGDTSIHFTSKVNYNGKTLDAFGMPLQMGLGPAFYFDVSERIKIVSGIGFHLSVLLINAMESWAKEVKNNSNLPEYFIWEIWAGMGIGGKINVDFKINESVDFETGCSFAYDFHSSYKKYQAIYITPHIGISLKK
jgi:hypothetical protein